MPRTPTSSQCTTTPGASLSTTCSSASPLTPPHDQIALGPLDNIPHIISPPSNSSCTSSYNSLPELDPLTWLPALLPINSVRLSSALSPQPCTPRNFNPNTPIFSHMWKEFDALSLCCACPGVFSEQQNLTRWCWVFGLVPMVLVWISGLEGRCGRWREGVDRKGIHSAFFVEEGKSITHWQSRSGVFHFRKTTTGLRACSSALQACSPTLRACSILRPYEPVS